MLLSAVSVLVVAQSSSEIPEGLMNNPVLERMVLGCLLVPGLFLHRGSVQILAVIVVWRP